MDIIKQRGGLVMHEQCLENKFFNVAHSLLEYQWDLELSDEIRDLKINTKKELIKLTAEIEILSVDIISRLCEHTIDSDEITRLIEKKFELKKERLKTLADAFITLKKIITKEQMEEIKSIYNGEMSTELREKTFCK